MPYFNIVATTNENTVELGAFKKLKAEDLVKIYTAAK